MQPIGMPSRSLKFEIDFFALPHRGFWPVMCASSLAAASSSFAFRDRVAHAHVDHDLHQARRLHDVRVAELLHQRRAHLLLVVLRAAAASPPDPRAAHVDRPRSRAFALVALAGLPAFGAFAASPASPPWASSRPPSRSLRVRFARPARPWCSWAVPGRIRSPVRLATRRFDSVSPLARETRSRLPSGRTRTPTRDPLLGLRVVQQHVRQVERRFLLDDAALRCPGAAPSCAA